MAYFDFPSVDDIIKDFGEVEKLPDEVAEKMLETQAGIVIKAQKKAAEENGIVDTGRMRNSIEKNVKMRVQGLSRYIDIYPRGTRKKMTSYRVSGKKKESGIRRPVTNAEVAFIHEFGAKSRNIPAKHWIKNANEAIVDEATHAAAEVFDKYLKSKNL